MKNLEQLRYLQQLFDDGILNEKEFAEQKNNVLSSLQIVSSCCACITIAIFASSVLVLS